MNLIKIHPSIYIIYYVIWLVFLFLFNHPYYIIASYVAIFALIILQGIRSEFKNMIKMVIPLAILVLVLNPLIYRDGVHHIYIIGSFYITLEATLYGCILCATLLLVFLLFASYNRAVSYQDMLYVFSKKFSNLSMVMIMALRFVPLLNSRITEVRHINFGNVNGSEKSSFKDKVKNAGSIFAVVTAWSLEESMLTAKSMKSRAYGVAERTNYLSFEFNLIDYVLLVFMILVLVVEFIGLFYGYGRINIYPVIDLSINQINFFLGLWILFLMPLIAFELYERVLWYKHNKKKLSKYNKNIVNEIATPNLSNLCDGSENVMSQTNICFNIDEFNLTKIGFDSE